MQGCWSSTKYRCLYWIGRCDHRNVCLVIICVLVWELRGENLNNNFCKQPLTSLIKWPHAFCCPSLWPLLPPLFLGIWDRPKSLFSCTVNFYKWHFLTGFLTLLYLICQLRQLGINGRTLIMTYYRKKGWKHWCSASGASSDILQMQT